MSLETLMAWDYRVEHFSGPTCLEIKDDLLKSILNCFQNEKVNSHLQIKP